MTGVVPNDGNNVGSIATTNPDPGHFNNVVIPLQQNTQPEHL